MTASTSKKPRPRRSLKASEGELVPEYGLDYRRSRRNRFAGKVSTDAVVVVLDDDVAEVFRDPESVNALLRAAIAALRGRRRNRGHRVVAASRSK